MTSATGPGTATAALLRFRKQTAPSCSRKAQTFRLSLAGVMVRRVLHRFIGLPRHVRVLWLIAAAELILIANRTLAS
jgi:hypothetical protein